MQQAKFSCQENQAEFLSNYKEPIAKLKIRWQLTLLKLPP